MKQLHKIILLFVALMGVIPAHATFCEPESIPWSATFLGAPTNGTAPDCWTVLSETPYVWVGVEKTYDDSYNATVVPNSEFLYATGGAAYPQVFVTPVFDARLDTLEIAFDYKDKYIGSNYAVLEVGYLTDMTNTSSFVSLHTLTQSSTYSHVTLSLAGVPTTVKSVAFRYAGGTSAFGGIYMDNFVVAGVGKSGENIPQEEVPDSHIYGLTYCEAQFTWMAYYVDAFAIGLFDAASQQLIAGIVTTTEECDRFAYQDGVGFSEFEDYENKYYCSTKWILNVDEEGLSKGAAWNNCVINVGTAVSPILALRPGDYQVQIYKYVQGESLTNKLATIPFTLTEKKVENLAAVVAADKTTATLTWDAPTFATGERLYIRVWSGETVAYDNYGTTVKPTSPLTVNVVEGKSYTATVQVIDKNDNPLGQEVQIGFTVGVNNYEPTNVHAEVAGGDNVTFSWNVTTEADRYVIVLYCDGEYYTSLTVSGTSKLTTMPKDGTWTWTVQAFNLGSNGNYFEASNAIEGNSFVSKAADIPEDAIVMNTWGMEAGYLDQYVSQFPAGQYGWMVMFATGEEGGTGMPMPSFLLYTTKENAISGIYNATRGNIDLESCYINTNGTQAGCIMATDAEVRLQFVAYDDDKAAQGPYRYGYYTGQFRLVGTDGNTYVGKFMETFCNSYNYSTAGSSIRDHKGMWDEDPDYIAPQGIEAVTPDAEKTIKVLHEGQLYIIMPNGTIYNAAGMRVK